MLMLENVTKLFLTINFKIMVRVSRVKVRAEVKHFILRHKAS